MKKSWLYGLIVLAFIGSCYGIYAAHRQLYVKYIRGQHPEEFIMPATRWGTIDEKRFHPTKALYYRQNPQRNDVYGHFDFSRKPVKQWDFEGLNVGIHGASKSSPLADESGVYVGADTAWFYALDHDGKVRWKFLEKTATRGYHSTAVIVGDYVFMGSYSGVLVCFDKLTGEMIWSRQVGHTFGAAPAYFEGDLIAAVETGSVVNGFVIRLDARTGETKWVSEFIGEQSHSSPVIDKERRKILFGANNKKFFGVDLETGKIDWVHDLDGEMKSTPVLLDGRVYFNDWGGKFYCLEVVTGSECWKKTMTVMSQASAVYAPRADLMIASDASGTLFAYDPDSGRERWRLPGGMSRMMTSPFVVLRPQELIVYNCRENELCWIESQTGKIKGSIPLSHRLTSVPIIYKDSIYIAYDMGPLQKWTFE